MILGPCVSHTLVKLTLKVHGEGLFHHFYLGVFADLILIKNAGLIMDFAQFVGHNFSPVTLSFLICQVRGDRANFIRKF